MLSPAHPKTKTIYTQGWTDVRTARRQAAWKPALSSERRERLFPAAHCAEGVN
jgi:hypothetical protein